jgi:hypothetical protein
MLWGLTHGVFLVINHGWRTVVPKSVRTSVAYERLMAPLGWLITFVAVAFAMVLFRSPSVPAAVEILAGMTGLNGLALPQAILDQIGPALSVLSAVMPVTPSGSALELAIAMGWVSALLAIVLLLPNSLEVMARYEPAIAYRRPSEGRFGIFMAVSWRPTLLWMIGTASLAACAAYSMGGPSEFLYWQF